MALCQRLSGLFETWSSLQSVLGKKQLALQSSISRFLDFLTETNIDKLQAYNRSLIDTAHLIRNYTELIIDVESTHLDTTGRQEHTDYNARTQTYSYHPLITFDGLIIFFLRGWTAFSKSVYIKRVKVFIDRLLQY